MKRRLHIVFVCNHFMPRVGGVELSVHHTASALTHAGHDVTVVTETPAPEEEGVSYKVVRFYVQTKRPFTRFYYWNQMWSLRRLFSEADVLHFHDYIPLIHWFLPLRLFIHKPMYAITFHGYEGTPVLFRHQVFRSLATWIVDVVFGVGDYQTEIYTHRFDDFYIGAPIRRSDTNSSLISGVRLAYIGRFERDTQIDACVRHLSHFASYTRTTIQLNAVGAGSLQDDILAQANDNFSINIIPSTTDIEPILQQNGIVIASGFLSILDGLASGKPVIVPALSEFKLRYVLSIPHIQECVFIIRNENDFRQVMQTVIDHSPIVDEKLSVSRRVANSLTWEMIAQLHMRHYDKFLPMREAFIAETILPGVET